MLWPSKENQRDHIESMNMLKELLVIGLKKDQILWYSIAND